MTLSGQILEVLPDGSRKPIAAYTVSLEVEGFQPGDPRRGGWIDVGHDSRYTLSGIPDGRTVSLGGVGLLGPRPHKLCATSTVMRGDTQMDVLLYLPGARLPSPVLSGQVFTVIDDRRVPVAGVAVYFGTRGLGPDVADYTDADGRFALCAVPPVPGSFYMVCGNDAVPMTRNLTVRTDTSIEVDTTSFRDCLLPLP